MQNQELVLMLAAAALMLVLALLAQRRGAAARARLEQAKRDAELEDLGGNSYFMPPPPLEQAVELDDAVEIDSLLSGESDTVAAQARQQLERTTDVDLTAGLRNLSLSLGSASPPPPPLPAPLAQRRADPPAPPTARPAQAGAGSGAVQGAPAAATTGVEEAARVPVRELVLAWFEARGYRAATLTADSLPIELLLRHSKTPERTYAFVVERNPLTAQRANSLFTLARSAGFQRLLVASEGPAEAGLADKVHRQGIRVFDEDRIRGELGKIDISVAAKIIAVARGRAAIRRAAAAAAGSRSTASARKDSATVGN